MNIAALNTLIGYHRWRQEKLYRKAMKIPEELLLETIAYSPGDLDTSIDCERMGI